jgi:probable sporulation protein (polysaccharide deacetylase family)
MKIFYLPFNRDVLLAIIGVIILVSFGMIKFDGSRNFTCSQTVFTQQAEPYYSGVTEDKKAALKINVAWGEDHIPQMLEVLDDHEVKATFFFLGKWVEKFPELTKRIQEEGHEIANHGYEHVHPKQLSKEEIMGLIKKNEEIIKEVTGQKTNLFAPPYGEVNETITEAADEIGYTTIMWSADTIDWQRPDPEVIKERVLTKIEPGGIVLMHPTEPTAQALPQIISELREKDYELVTVSQLLE